MAEAVLNIKKWGNNLGVRLPAAVAREIRYLSPVTRSGGGVFGRGAEEALERVTPPRF